MTRKVTVEFPDGPRDIEPQSWAIDDEGRLTPVFNPSAYRIVATVDGRFIAVRDSE